LIFFVKLEQNKNVFLVGLGFYCLPTFRFSKYIM
jgi:hypothetical protein